jgi:ankyrin repeat protein
VVVAVAVLVAVCVLGGEEPDIPIVDVVRKKTPPPVKEVSQDAREMSYVPSDKRDSSEDNHYQVTQSSENEGWGLTESFTPLMRAAHKGDVKAVRLLLAAATNPKIEANLCVASSGDSPLGRAIEGWRIAVAGHYDSKTSPLPLPHNREVKVVERYKAVLDELLRAGASPVFSYDQMARFNTMGPLYMAVNTKLVEAVDLLVAATSCVRLAIRPDPTLGIIHVLHAAARCDVWFALVCQSLLRHHTNPWDLSKRGQRIPFAEGLNVTLDEAEGIAKDRMCDQNEVWHHVWQQSERSLTVLLERFRTCDVNPPLNEPHPDNLEPPLIEAVRANNILVVRKILSAPMICNTADHPGHNKGDTCSASLLVVDGYAQTALHSASKMGKGFEKMVFILLQHAFTNNNGRELVRLLSKLDSFGRTARKLAKTPTTICLLAVVNLAVREQTTTHAPLPELYQHASDGMTECAKELFVPGAEEVNFSVAGTDDHPSDWGLVAAAAAAATSTTEPSGWKRYTSTPPLMAIQWTGSNLKGVSDRSRASIKPVLTEVQGAVDQDVFIRDFVSASKPAIFRGGVAGWKALKSWTPKSLGKKIDEHYSVTVGPIPYAGQDGFVERTIPFQSYTKAMLRNGSSTFAGGVADIHNPPGGQVASPEYMFDAEVLNTVDIMSIDWNGVESDARSMEWQNLKAMHMLGTNLVSHQFIMGGEGSGSPVHFHVSAMNWAIVGRKRWFLWPPAERFWSNKPSLEWLQQDYCNLPSPPIEVIQNPGDIIYVPRDYGHAVINLEDSVAVAFEFMEGVRGTCNAPNCNESE